MARKNLISLIVCLLVAPPIDTLAANENSFASKSAETRPPYFAVSGADRQGRPYAPTSRLAAVVSPRPAICRRAGFRSAVNPN